MDKDYLMRLDKLVKQLRSDAGSKYKVRLLRKHGEMFKELLALIYDTNKPFNIKSASFRLNVQGSFESGEYDLTIFGLLYRLMKKEITGDKSIYTCAMYTCYNYTYKDLIYNIIDKDLKCGINTKTINTAWPGLIPDFKSHVPLANKYEPKKVDFKDDWYVSRKLDGVRCLCFIEGSKITFYSRTGKEFHTLDKLKNHIQICLKDQKLKQNIILDGEVCSVNKDGNESFKDISKEIRRKDHQINAPYLYVFDYYTIEDFHTGIFKTPIDTIPLVRVLNSLPIKQVAHSIVVSQDRLNTLIDTIPNHWEGLMLKKYPTQFKRSNNLLKIKRFKELEARISACEYGTKFIDGIHQECLSSISIKYKGNTVHIGSGFTDEERLQYLDASDLIGKLVTVKYKKETTNQNGKHSLEFPTFKGVRDYE